MLLPRMLGDPGQCWAILAGSAARAAHLRRIKTSGHRCYGKIMGRRVLGVRISGPTSSLSAHAACARQPAGAVTIAFLNPQARPASICVRFSQVAHTALPTARTRDEYRLTAGEAATVTDPGHNLTSRGIRLNGGPPLQASGDLVPRRVVSKGVSGNATCSGEANKIRVLKLLRSL